MEKINEGKITELWSSCPPYPTRLPPFPVIRFLGGARSGQCLPCPAHRGPHGVCEHGPLEQDRCWAWLASHTNICSAVGSQSREPACSDWQGVDFWVRCSVLPSVSTRRGPPELFELASTTGTASAAGFRNNLPQTVPTCSGGLGLKWVKATKVS